MAQERHEVDRQAERDEAAVFNANFAIVADTAYSQQPAEMVAAVDAQRRASLSVKADRRASDEGYVTFVRPMIGSHGCVSPTRWEAIAEALERIDCDERCASPLPSPTT